MQTPKWVGKLRPPEDYRSLNREITERYPGDRLLDKPTTKSNMIFSNERDMKLNLEQVLDMQSRFLLDESTRQTPYMHFISLKATDEEIKAEYDQE